MKFKAKFLIHGFLIPNGEQRNKENNIYTRMNCYNTKGNIAIKRYKCLI